MLHSKKILSWGLLSLVAMTTACGDEAETFSATLPYQLGAGLNCQAAKVTTVRAVFGALRETVVEGACDNSGQLAANGVPKGTWPLTIEGVDAAGAVIMSSAVGSVPPNVEIIGDGATTPRLTLANVPAKMQLRWDLGFGSCESMNLQGFKVDAWDRSKGRMLMSGMIDCSAPANEQMYRSLPDPNHQLSGTELMALTIQPTLKDNQSFGAPVVVDLAAPPGPGYIVRLGIKCDVNAAACTADPAGVQVAAQ